MASSFVRFAVLGVQLTLAAALFAEPSQPAGPVVRFAYFVPTDRTAPPDIVERLDRVMTEVQDFYGKGMDANGYGRRTFNLDRDAKGALLKLYIVKGRQPMQAYGRNGADLVRKEVKESLAAQGVKMDEETFVVFQLLLDWRDGKAIEIGPYVGGGGPTSGTAWVYDDPHLDPKLLSSREAGGYYGHPCSWGEFNTHYIGGIAHELGHAFGLPHDCEQVAQRQKMGHSLMGGGNHTYGRELRNEGPGAFLSAASAMILSRHPLFGGDRTAARARATCTLKALAATYADNTLTLRGQFTAQPPAFGVIAYNDDEAKAGDYDAVSWTSLVKPDGSFEIKVGEIKPGSFELRLRACHTNGRTTTVARYKYTTNSEGKPDLSAFAKQ